ncbi:MAG: SHOCT domain-containing protein [Gaiellaceae bacterium]
MFDDFSGGEWAVMVMMMLAMLGVILAAVWLIARPLSTWAGSKASRDPALEALRSRYARGEIDQEEFDRRKRDLA